MSCYLTDAREALLAAFQANATLGHPAVKTWYDWGAGLHRRFNLDPGYLPAVSLTPAELDEEAAQNVATGWAQDLAVVVATDGQDAAPCEELVAAVTDVVAAASGTCLGLSADGLTHLEILRIMWQAREDETSHRVRWQAEIVVRIHWLRWRD